MKITALISRLAILAIACLLPFGRYVSIFIFLLAFCRVSEGNFRMIPDTLRRKPYVMLFAALPLLLALGYFYSEDKFTALLRLKISLPLLILPLITVTSDTITEKLRDTVLHVFVLAVIIATFAGAFSYYNKGAYSVADPRQMSLFMTHIRFSLLVNFAIAVILGFNLRRGEGKWKKVTGFVLAAILTAYLFILGSLTGIIILAVILAFYVYKYLTSLCAVPRSVAITLASLPFLAAIAAAAIMYSKNFTGQAPDASSLDKYTAGGNLYYHNVSSGILENGYYTDIYISEDELRKEWNTAGRLPFDGPDLQGQNLSYTLRRYMTSKGLRKDSAGFHQLTATDIEAIENGIANHRFSESSFLYKRLYETMWEIHVFLKSGYSKDHSFAQRLAFWKASLLVASDNLLAGTGTGDAMFEIRKRAISEEFSFEETWEGKPHNQFLYYITGSGLPVLILIVFSWIWPLTSGKKIRNPVTAGFLIVSWLSMFTLDTLESHDSVIFYAFFYSLLVLRDYDS